MNRQIQMDEWMNVKSDYLVNWMFVLKFKWSSTSWRALWNTFLIHIPIGDIQRFWTLHLSNLINVGIYHNVFNVFRMIRYKMCVEQCAALTFASMPSIFITRPKWNHPLNPFDAHRIKPQPSNQPKSLSQIILS